MTIKTLHKKGVIIRQIAQQLKISRNTVTKYIDHDGQPCYNRKEPYKSILDEYQGYILERLTDHPKITAERLHREPQEKGFKGSYPTAVNFLHKHRPDKKPQPHARYETSPAV